MKWILILLIPLFLVGDSLAVTIREGVYIKDGIILADRGRSTEYRITETGDLRITENSNPRIIENLDADGGYEPIP